MVVNADVFSLQNCEDKADFTHREYTYTNSHVFDVDNSLEINSDVAAQFDVVTFTLGVIGSLIVPSFLFWHIREAGTALDVEMMLTMERGAVVDLLITSSSTTFMLYSR